MPQVAEVHEPFMRARGRRVSLAALVSVFIATASLCAANSFDVVVYGATPSGIMAAVSAAREGMRVALVEPTSHVGGMVSGGLSNSDVDNQKQLIGGLARAFFISAGSHYGQPIAWAFEPHVAEQILNGMLRAAHVDTYLGCRLANVRKTGTKIESLRCEDGHEFQALVFLDSSYEGDLMKAAGVAYVVGREGTSQYGESLAGRQDLLPGHHQFKFPVSADDSTAGLLPYVTPQEKVANIGQARRQVSIVLFSPLLDGRARRTG